MSRAIRRILAKRSVTKVGPGALSPEVMGQRLKEGSDWVVLWGGSLARGEVVTLVKHPKRGADEEIKKTLEPGEGVAAHCGEVIDELLARGYYKPETRQERLDEVRGALELHGWNWDGAA